MVLVCWILAHLSQKFWAIVVVHVDCPLLYVSSNFYWKDISNKMAMPIIIYCNSPNFPWNVNYQYLGDQVNIQTEKDIKLLVLILWQVLLSWLLEPFFSFSFIVNWWKSLIRTRTGKFLYCWQMIWQKP